MLTLADFTYVLPPQLIAQTPADPRDSSRLLCLNSQTGQIHHRHFYDLPELLTTNDVLVRNNTKVLPARLLGQKSSGGQVEVLLIKKLPHPDQEVWECLTKPGLKPGQNVLFSDTFTGTCQAVTGYTRQLQFNLTRRAFMQALDSQGQTPLPPYIEWQVEDETHLREVYQTTYAKLVGSAAAPTAGLHFTPALDKALTQRGVQIAEVTLHVGLGTFLPVKTNNLEDHHMHSEWFDLSPATADTLNQAKQAGKRIIAVGTTTCRVLESCVENGQLRAGSGETDIFIYPPYQFKCVDSLITNFHLPESTLLMLISALVSVPNTPHTFTKFLNSSVGKAYQAAMAEKYRFFSFGDAMWITHQPDSEQSV